VFIITEGTKSSRCANVRKFPYDKDTISRIAYIQQVSMYDLLMYQVYVYFM
jgi:hypothetical protein